MLKRTATSRAFSALGNPKAKLLLLGPAVPQHAELVSEARSFSIEHVSPATLVQQEISRQASHGDPARRQDPERLQLAVIRRWYWSRKPDAGFLLEGFPATLLQAKVFDEWMDARGETLSGVIAGSLPAGHPVAGHYRTQGLLLGASRAAAETPGLALV